MAYVTCGKCGGKIKVVRVDFKPACPHCGHLLAYRKIVMYEPIEATIEPLLTDEQYNKLSRIERLSHDRKIRLRVMTDYIKVARKNRKEAK